ncbi:GNAT family N-acetyltransferase [Thalassococcus sp. CAU 1522]|uniref:GNAT family N-acetyltransferase n=1 Tax=Thalassococcus arenae TaxID=2851652 RepID=A0ABS6NAR3_9RHOB|nr:GNAT family N-acetyltransferase [Thalassococcus arenae]MBV2361106.1 GNAT family N-acetyltransferase [Thalassococcus arenae]
MNRQPVLIGSALRLDPLTETDREGLFAAASDPLIWEQHPAKTRHQRAAYDPYFDGLLRSGGTLAVREIATDRIVGTSTYYSPQDEPGGIAIGFTFLTRDHWGGASNREMKALMLGHAFAEHDAVWFHIGPDNIRSQRATAKLGAEHVATGPVEIFGVTAPYQSWKLQREIWGK